MAPFSLIDSLLLRDALRTNYLYSVFPFGRRGCIHIQMGKPYLRNITQANRRYRANSIRPYNGQAMFLMFNAYKNDGTQIAGI